MLQSFLLSSASEFCGMAMMLAVINAALNRKSSFYVFCVSTMLIFLMEVPILLYKAKILDKTDDLFTTCQRWWENVNSVGKKSTFSEPNLLIMSINWQFHDQVWHFITKSTISIPLIFIFTTFTQLALFGLFALIKY